MENLLEDGAVAGQAQCWKPVPHDEHEWASMVADGTGEFYVLFSCAG